MEGVSIEGNRGKGAQNDRARHKRRKGKRSGRIPRGGLTWQAPTPSWYDGEGGEGKAGEGSLNTDQKRERRREDGAASIAKKKQFWVIILVVFFFVFFFGVVFFSLSFSFSFLLHFVVGRRVLGRNRAE